MHDKLADDRMVRIILIVLLMTKISIGYMMIIMENKMGKIMMYYY